MKLNKIKKILSVILMLLVCINLASAMCVVKGYISNDDNSPVNEGTPISIIINDRIEYQENTGGHVPNFYISSLYNCFEGDNITVKVDYGNAHGEIKGIVKIPTTEIDLTLTKTEQQTPPSISQGGAKESPKIIVKEEIKNKTYPCRTFNIKDNEVFEIGLCDKAAYKFKNSSQEFKLLFINKFIVSGILNPLDYPIGLDGIGSEAEFDIDNNGANDLKINLINISNNKVKLRFQQIKEVFPEIIIEKPTKIEQPIQQQYSPNIAKYEIATALFTLSFIIILIANIILIYIQLRERKGKL